MIGVAGVVVWVSGAGGVTAFGNVEVVTGRAVEIGLCGVVVGELVGRVAVPCREAFAGVAGIVVVTVVVAAEAVRAASVK